MPSDAERFELLGAVFTHARDLESRERAAYLSAACGDDEDLRTEVEELLAEDARGIRDAVDHALVGGAAPITPHFSARPELVGKYRILGICGSGGMGTVYEAKQESPKRRVAVKVIQPDSLRPDLLSRFRRETEILGRLDHPCIAQIFEAGEFEQDGLIRPFFAMEFVDGTSLVEFADQHGLSTAARIDLIVEICDAIQYAHDRGVVHRDLKPDNVLVVETSDSRTGSTTTFGRPKILDFGVARLTDLDSEATLQTSDGTLLGSVAYMSPEQASGGRDDVDGRSDLYSLGVITFELLSGELPYAVRGRPLAEALDAIRYHEPTLLHSVDPTLADDLGTIIGKCLQKDRAHRYGRVAELAQDLRAFRELKPIKARPPSSWYQLKRFAQRNRVLVGGVVASTLAVTLGAVAALLFAVQSNENARTSRAHQLDAERATYRASLLAASSLLESDPGHVQRILASVPEEQRGWEYQYLSSAVCLELLEFGDVDPTPPGFRVHRPSSEMFLLSGGEEAIARSAPAEFRIWEVRSGRSIRSFSAPEAVQQFAVSADGSTLVAALESGRIVVTHPTAGDTRWETWRDREGVVDALAISSNGGAVAFEDANGVSFGRRGDWKVFVPPGARAPHGAQGLEFDPDGATLTVLRSDLHRVDVGSGEELHEPIPSTQGHWAIDVSSSGKLLAAGQRARELRIFDLATRELVGEFFGHTGTIIDVAFGPDERVVSVANGGGVRVWDLRLGTTVTHIDAPGTVKAEFVGVDQLLTLTNGRLKLWTLKSSRARELVGHGGRVFVPIFSGDSTLLATSAPWEDLAIWDPLETEPLRRFTADRREQFTFDRDGDTILDSRFCWSERDGTRSWVTGRWSDPVPNPRGAYLRYRMGEIQVDGRGAPYVPGSMNVIRAVHPIGPSSTARTMHVDGERWPIRAAQESGASDPGSHPRLTFGGMLSYEFAGEIAEWIAYEGELSDASAGAIEAYLSARGNGEAVAVPSIPEEARLLLHFRADAESLELSAEGDVRSWAAVNNRSRCLRPAGSYGNASKLAPQTSTSPARVKISNGWGGNNWLETDFPELLAADEVTVFWLGTFDEKLGHSTAYALGHLDLPFAKLDRAKEVRKVGPMLSHSSDGRHVALGFNDTVRHGWVQVRDVDTSHIVASFEDRYTCTDFHPDGRRLACGHLDGHVDILDVQTLERVARIDAHDDQVLDVAFSPDGTRLASAGNDNALRLWSTERYEPLLELPGHRSYVRGIAWSPDNTMLVSVCGDFTVRVWDSVSKKERYTQRLANRALEDEVRAEVEALHRAGPDEAAEEVCARWPNDVPRRRAAQKVLARCRDGQPAAADK